MLAVLEFIFSGFWTWLGTVVLLWIVTEGASRFLSALFAAFVARSR